MKEEKDSKKYLTEGAKLGHFEPEILNVDINDIRKGIMPEFPKDPPPEMVNGYNPNSRLAPKELDPAPYIKITRKDLAQNHKLTDKEITEFMNDIKMVNEYIKENPADLIYAQTRYPKHDPRLAQLNWQMDQMLDASKEYMDKTFPENEKLFKKIQKTIKKNIELTDPKSFKDVEIPNFKGVNLIDFKRRKEVVSRHFKKAVKIERLFSNKERRNSIREERGYLNNESENNTLKEFMTTTGMYFATRENPAIPAVTATVPDSTGVLGSGFTAPIGGDGNDVPSNYPAAYDTAWMYNSNDVDGVTNRPIVKTMDQSVIDAYNTAYPDDNRFPSGGAGIVFGNIAFGTGVGYASNGHYKGVLSPGLFGNGSTKMVPPGSPFGAPWFGMSGMYFPATPELAGVIMSMTGTYQSLGGYNTDPSKVRVVYLWRNHSTFHDGQYDNWSGKKYTDSATNNRYVLHPFYMFTASNDYVQEPAVPVTTTVLYRNDLGDPGFLPIKIDLGDLSDQGFQYLSDKSGMDISAAPYYSIEDKKNVQNYYQKLKDNPNYQPKPYERESLIRQMRAQGDGPQFASTGTSFPPSEPDKFPVDPPPEVPDEPPAPPKPDPDPDSDRKKDPAGLDATAIKAGYNDPYFPVNPDGHYIALVTSAQDALSAEMDYAFYSAAASGESPNYDTAAINKAKETLRKSREKLDNWERWKKENNYVWKGSIDSSAEADRRKDVLDKDKQIDNELEKLKKDQAQAEADAEMYAAEAQKLIAQFGIDVALTLFGGKILSLAGKAIGKIPAVAKFFKLGKAAQKAQIDDALRGQSSKIPGLFKNAKNVSADDVLSGITKKDTMGTVYDDLFRLLQRNEPLSTSVQGGQTIIKSRTGDVLRIYDRKLGKFVKPPEFQVFSHELDKEKLLSEAAKLGHFEPEQLNVNIEDLRKGIMPEFPEEEPPELINGYSSKSRLAPKKLERSSFIKITKKDLAKNHKLKDSEIKDFMNKINAVNDFIKKHPEELVYAQTRYPKSDPRLAQLNWEMDQKLNASKQYMDQHYPENQRLFTKIQKSINKNIELTDPKSFKGVKIPKFKGVDLTDYKRRKALVSRHFKKAIRKNNKKT